jgi:3-oxoacyl-[acyl-carrier-protein] synthase-3
MTANNNYAVGFLGTGYYLPEKVLTNADLEKIVETSDEWITERTGIKERRLAEDDVPMSTLAQKAAERALEDAGVKAEELDLIIVATLTSDRIIPSTACMLQTRLGATHAAAFDLSAACSGFVYAAMTASQFIKNGVYKKALVVGAETLSKYINWEDRNTCVLFGDGAGAAVLGQVEDGYGILSFDLGSDGSGGDAIQIPSSGSLMPVSKESIDKRLNLIHMDGRETFKFAVKAMGRTVETSLKKIDMPKEQIDWLVPHQANIRIIQSAAKRLSMPMEKVVVNIHKYGNMSAACIPIALAEAAAEKRFKKGDIVALSGFGAGLTWASCIMRWSKED